jgi:ATP-dependent DNA ligase
MKPMLARTLGPKFSQFPCYVQPKLNGERVLEQRSKNKIVLQSRGEKLWKGHFFVELRTELLQLNLDENIILDGEFYFHGWRLQRINKAIGVNNNNPNEDTSKIELHVFDCVDPRKPFSDRYLDLANLLREKNLPHIRAVDTAMVHNREELDRYFHMCVAHGYEGTMVRPDGLYEFGEHVGRGGNMTQYRSRKLWKYKQWEDGEWECTGMTQGEGKADIGIGALVFKTKAEPITVLDKNHLPNEGFTFTEFKVGTGFTDEERAEFMSNPPVGKMVKIRYLCLTNDGIPFNPSFLAVLS